MDSINSSLGKRKSLEFCEYRLQNPSRAKNTIWKSFKQYAEAHNRKEYVVCMICRQAEESLAQTEHRSMNPSSYEVKYGDSKSTGKLEKHIKTRHSSELAAISQSNASEHIRSGKKITDFVCYGGKAEVALFKFIVHTYQPMSLVENQYFRDYCLSLNSSARCYSRKYVSSKLSDIAIAVKEKIKVMIDGKYVALTGDKWSSVTHQSYLGLTCHFINDDWELMRVTLKCSPTESEGSTATETANGFMRVIDEYGIDKAYISAIVTDTEPTMNAFGRILKESSIPWLGCVDHILELSTGKAFDDAVIPGNNGCRKACRQLVSTFQHSLKSTHGIAQANPTTEYSHDSY
jgi:hypothetical protein